LYASSTDLIEFHVFQGVRGHFVLNNSVNPTEGLDPRLLLHLRQNRLEITFKTYMYYVYLT
jgi:hypothetical protein